MQPSAPTAATEKKWIYVSLTVMDGERKLKPGQVCSEHLQFNDPPHIQSEQVEVILRNGDEEQRTMAIVLPHDPEATRIPIRLVSES